MDFEFEEFRMKELQQRTSYQRADPLTDEEMKIIFNHPQISRDNPRGFYIVFL